MHALEVYHTKVSGYISLHNSVAMHEQNRLRGNKDLSRPASNAHRNWILLCMCMTVVCGAELASPLLVQLFQNQFCMHVVPGPFPPRAGDVIHPVRLVRGTGLVHLRVSKGSRALGLDIDTQRCVELHAAIIVTCRAQHPTPNTSTPQKCATPYCHEHKYYSQWYIFA